MSRTIDTLDRPVLVVGAGRCGTTLAMRMLRAGGVPYGTGVDSTSGEHQLDALLAAAISQPEPGRAVKYVTRGRGLPPRYTSRRDWAVLHMTRNTRDQGRSTARFLTETVPHLVADADRMANAIGRHIGNERPVLRRQLAYFGDVLEIDYDQLLATPHDIAHRIEELLDVAGFDAGAAGAEVDPEHDDWATP